MSLKRYLDSIETMMLNAAPAQVAEFEGHVDEELLTRAFNYVCEMYPVLKARIQHDGAGYLLNVPPNAKPSVTVMSGDESVMRGLASAPWDPSEAAAKLILVNGHTGGYVGLRADHSIVDGRSWTAMFQSLWRLYTDLVGRVEVSVVPEMSLPSSPSSLLKQRLSGEEALTRALEGQVASRSTDSPNVSDYFERVESRIRLTEGETDGLRSLARLAKTSVHGLVCGSLLCAMRAMSTALDAKAMACLSFVDLRKRVGENVSATDSTNLLSIHRADLVVPCDPDPLVLGSEVKRQLDMAEKLGELRPIDNSGYASDASPLPNGRYATLAVTNLGLVSKFAQPDGVRIIDWWRVVPTTNRTPKYPVFGVYTYDGSLSLRGNCAAALYGQKDIDDIVGRSAYNLRALSGGRGGDLCGISAYDQSVPGSVSGRCDRMER